MLRPYLLMLVGLTTCMAEAPGGHSEDGTADLEREAYAEIVRKAAQGDFSEVTILYLDANVKTRVAVTPQTLANLGCHLHIRGDSPKWKDLIAILQNVSASSSERTSGELRWGLLFRETGSTHVDELYFGPYYGPQMDSRNVFGYVGRLAAAFPAALPRQMTSYIQGLGC